MRLRSPQCGRLEPGRWRNVRADDLEQLAGESLGCPVREPDAAAISEDPQHLTGGPSVIRREHGAEGGKYDIETRVSVGQILRIGDLEGDVQAFGVCAGLALLEQRGNVIRRRYLRKTPRRGQGSAAIPGR